MPARASLGSALVKSSICRSFLAIRCTPRQTGLAARQDFNRLAASCAAVEALLVVTRLGIARSNPIKLCKREDLVPQQFFANNKAEKVSIARQAKKFRGLYASTFTGQLRAFLIACRTSSFVKKRMLT